MTIKIRGVTVVVSNLDRVISACRCPVHFEGGEHPRVHIPPLKAEAEGLGVRVPSMKGLRIFTRSSLGPATLYREQNNSGRKVGSVNSKRRFKLQTCGRETVSSLSGHFTLTRIILNG